MNRFKDWEWKQKKKKKREHETFDAYIYVCDEQEESSPLIYSDTKIIRNIFEWQSEVDNLLNVID